MTAIPGLMLPDDRRARDERAHAGLPAWGAAWERLLAERRPFVAVLEPELALYRQPERVRALRAEWVRRNAILLRRYCRGIVVVVPSACQRHRLRTYLGLCPPLVPTELHPDRESAEEGASDLAVRCGAAVVSMA